jgi:hypothetical protein
MGKSLDRKDLADLVWSLNISDRTGTLIIRSHDGHAIMFVFEQGQIISLSHANHRGLDALPAILGFQQGSYSFHSTILGHHQDDLPSAKDIATALKQPPLPGGLSERLTKSTSVVSTATSAGPSIADPKRFWDQIESVYADYVGPIASLLCENMQSEMGTNGSGLNVQELITKLAQDISDQSERKQFLSKVGGIIEQHVL